MIGPSPSPVLCSQLRVSQQTIIYFYNGNGTYSPMNHPSGWILNWHGSLGPGESLLPSSQSAPLLPTTPWAPAFGTISGGLQTSPVCPNPSHPASPFHLANSHFLFFFSPSALFRLHLTLTPVLPMMKVVCPPGCFYNTCAFPIAAFMPCDGLPT